MKHYATFLRLYTQRWTPSLRSMTNFVTEPDFSMSNTPYGLQGKLLVATPHIGDPLFEKSVIYMCLHGEDGAMGVVVNHVHHGLTFTEVLENLSIDALVPPRGRVTRGGPVQEQRGFVLHSPDYAHDSTIKVTDEIRLTTAVEILRDIAEGIGPQNYLIALGCSQWSPGQLEQELEANAWISIEPDHELIFVSENEPAWKQAIDKLGIDPGQLASVGGHA
jgi:putative transcriptional regulator